MSADGPAAKPEPPVWHLVGRVGLVLGVVISAITLFLLTRPLWHDEAPLVSSVRITKPVVEQMSFAAYLNRVELPTAPYTEEQLGQPGALVEFAVTADGWNGKRLPIGWRLIDSKKGFVVAKNRDFLFEPERPSDEGDWRFFIELEGRDAEYVVEVQIFKPDQNFVLRDAKSDPFKRDPR